MIKKYVQTLLKVVIPIALIIIFINLGLKLIGLFWPFVVAYIVALAVSPIIDWFDAKIKIKPKYMSLILIAAILALIVLFLMYVFSTIAHSIPNLIEVIYSFLNNLENLELPFNINMNSIIDMVKNNMTTIIDYFSSLTGNASNIIAAIPDIFFKLIIMILASYFLIADRKRIGRFVYGHLKENVKEKVEIVLQESKVLVNAYIISQVKLMFFVAIILTIGFLILGFQIAIIIPLVAVIAFLDFLPVLGSGTILIPWFIYCFIAGNYNLGIGLLILYLVITVFRQMASPKIVGQQIGLSAFPSLLVMYAGYLLYGWVGLIISIPLSVLILNLYKKHFFDSFINDFKLLMDSTKDIFTK